MACSALTIAKRALIKIVLSLGICYNLVVTVNRDSDDADIVRACRRLVLKVHPDKGGRKKDFQSLQSARDTWDNARAASKPSGGRPLQLGMAGGEPGGFRVQCTAVLLTYCGSFTEKKWREFLQFVRSHITSWGVKYWCATLETSSEP